MQTLEGLRTVGIQCEWVPGTMDRVWVHLPDRDMQIPLEQLQKIAGVDAVYELYLKGLVLLPSEYFEFFAQLY